MTGLRMISTLALPVVQCIHLNMEIETDPTDDIAGLQTQLQRSLSMEDRPEFVFSYTNANVDWNHGDLDIVKRFDEAYRILLEAYPNYADSLHAIFVGHRENYMFGVARSHTGEAVGALLCHLDEDHVLKQRIVLDHFFVKSNYSDAFGQQWGSYIESLNMGIQVIVNNSAFHTIKIAHEDWVRYVPPQKHAIPPAYKWHAHYTNDENVNPFTLEGEDLMSGRIKEW